MGLVHPWVSRPIGERKISLLFNNQNCHRTPLKNRQNCDYQNGLPAFFSQSSESKKFFARKIWKTVKTFFFTKNDNSCESLIDSNIVFLLILSA
jgi:hypothetical protein